MEPNTTILAQSTKIAIRERDIKPGVMVQTQTLGITFEPNHKEIVTHCPKCGHQNTAIYWPNLLTQDGEYVVTVAEYLQKHGASVVCCDCGIPYPVKLETKDDLLARCDEGRQAREMF